MVCPHCKKPIKREHSPELKKRALALAVEGYSMRDIEALLERRVSFGTIARWVQEAKP